MSVKNTTINNIAQILLDHSCSLPPKTTSIWQIQAGHPVGMLWGDMPHASCVNVTLITGVYLSLRGQGPRALLSAMGAAKASLVYHTC